MAVDGDAAGAGVEADRPAGEFTFGVSGGAAQQRTHARQHLFEMKGLGDVIVGAGVVVLSLAAGPLRKRWSFGNVALGALMLSGLLTVGFAYTTSLPVAIVLWSAVSGLGILFNINTGSLRQAIVPNQMLGRVISIAMVLAWSANPIGALAGGVVIERTGEVRLVYAVIGILTFVIALVFRLASPLGHAERYLSSGAGAAAK